MVGTNRSPPGRVVTTAEFPSSITPRLGCATNYTAEIWVLDRSYITAQAPYPRLRLVTQITGITNLYWERTIDDYSEARIRFQPMKGDDCCGALPPRWNSEGELIQSGVWPWSHEVVIYRDGEPVWVGPIFSVDETVNPSEGTDFIQLNCRDHLAWLDRRVIQKTLKFGGNVPHDLVRIARQIVLDALAPDNLGILPVNVPRYPDSGRKGFRTTRQYEARAGDELREVARGGIDFTCIGRQIIIKGVKRDETVRAPELRNRDFQSGAEIRIVGAEAATKGYAIGAQPTNPNAVGAHAVMATARAPGVPASGIDPFFGLIEALTNSAETESTDFLKWLATELVNENMPPPRTLSIPANSTLSPDANVSVHELIPSRHFKLTIRGNCSQLSQYMRLSHVEASWEPMTPEKIGISFIPGNVTVDEETDPEA
jgi:hypothetical protein